MDDRQKQPFADCIKALFKTFGVEADKPTLLGYWMGLKDMELEHVQAAVMICIRECVHLPKPIEIRQKVEGTEESAGERAWAMLLRAVPLGPYKHVDFHDKYINAAVRQNGGWPAFLSRFSSAAEEKWAKNDFLRSYRNLRNAKVSGDVCDPLPGLSETLWSGKLLCAKDNPVRIGVNDGCTTNWRIHGAVNQGNGRPLLSSLQATPAGASKDA